ncbi:metallophosphoesterase [Comamonas endophytica]|uniref:Metallophosphoesterase n=1 Tax=Comamonas endophytica TaxID=2949090 RepID=A0ABY6GBG1_9BURK|nr:metallophosphoesterase [Acidovorax sp. 5MLIR]MCD2513761.1 metallophosphoesterase [Acidovorax sp. D4N7]UYG52236.1 metallophosphoesterase [Acidovorax sp. 5MLIR]
MFHVYCAIAYLFIVARVIAPLPIRLHWKLLAAAALLPGALYQFWSRVFFGNMYAPELPFPVVALLGWTFGSFVLLLVFTIVGEILEVLYRLAARRWSHPPRGTARRVASVVLAFALGGYGFIQAARLPEVHRVDLAVKDLPAELEGFRLVQLSDLHISKLFQRDWVRGVVERTNGIGADLIVVTGDVIDGSVEARRGDVEPLAQLRARHGVIGIPGNHEYYFDYGAWKPRLQELGIRMLTNQHEVVRHGDAQLTVAGIADAAALRYGDEGPDLPKALAGAPSGAPVVLLAHRPAGAANHAQQGVAVQLSGHTHGGMVVGMAPVIGPPNEGFLSRGYRVGGMQLYVSNGTGLWMGFPLRLGKPSEITEFVLTRGR